MMLMIRAPAGMAKAAESMLDMGLAVLSPASYTFLATPAMKEIFSPIFSHLVA